MPRVNVTSAGEIFTEILAGVEASDAEIREQVNEKAVEIRDYARSIAPVYAGPPHKSVTPGEFRDSIIAEETGHRGAVGGLQVPGELPSAMVSSYDRIAHLLEFGTKTMHERGTFAAAAAAFGGTGPDRVTVEGHASDIRAAIHEIQAAGHRVTSPADYL